MTGLGLELSAKTPGNTQNPPTRGTESGTVDAQTAPKTPPANPPATGELAPEPTTGAALAEALALIARLPLSDAERAEAVRRLLGG